jgi:hypothetical protein
MSEIWEIIKSLYYHAPWPVTFAVIAWMYFRSKREKIESVKPIQSQSDIQHDDRFVLREDCHGHIDAMTGELKEIKENIRLIFVHMMK